MFLGSINILRESMFFAIFLFLLVCDLCMGYKGKTSKVLICVNFIYMWVFISGYCEGIDIGNYINDYNTLSTRNYVSVFNDPGYILVIGELAKRGFSFFEFKKVATFVGLFLIYFSIYRMKKWNMMLVLGAYLVYEIFMDTIQYRNFMGLAFLMLGLSFLLENDIKGKICYLVCIIIASSFHSVMIVYLLFLLKDNELIFKYFKRVVGGLFILIIFITFINDRTIPFLRLILNFFGKTNIIGSGYSKANGSVAFILPLVSLILFIWVLSRYNRDYKNVSEIYKIDYLAVLFIPVCLMSFQWYRIIRNLNLINYVAISDLLEKKKENRLAKRNIMAILIALLVFWNMSDLIRFIGIDSISTVFTNNYFLIGEM